MKWYQPYILRHLYGVVKIITARTGEPCEVKSIIEYALQEDSTLNPKALKRRIYKAITILRETGDIEVNSITTERKTIIYKLTAVQ